MYTIGFDFGSVYTKAVLLDAGGNVDLTCYAKKGIDDRKLIDEFFGKVALRVPVGRFRAGAAGIEAGRSGGLLPVNAIIAIAEGIGRLHPGARSIIEIGGHTSKFIIFGDDGAVSDFSTNDACAAGTGSFLEQQSRRLNIDISELSRLSTAATRDATIAGRCSVFAKSDMIHLQQRGTSVEEICYGLCTAIARNALATLLRGCEPLVPVVIAGGCARNEGILRAFSEMLAGRGGCELVRSAYPGLEGATGAAIIAAAGGGEAHTLEDLRRCVSTALTSASGRRTTLEPLGLCRESGRKEEPAGAFGASLEGWLGIDLGSVSTDFVVLGRDGAVVSSIYLPTRGRPVDVLREGLEILRERFRHGLTILGCGATGSGRHLAARLLGADVVKNEITCQMLGTRHFIPGVESIVEIGGQDSKFIAVRDAGIADFVMNKICAAGTGSFLEEQAHELGIDIYSEFAPLAFTSEAPLDLGSRCTVFMETEVVNAVRHGIPAGEICAGLSYAIVKNYLNKVVGNRPLGNTIVFQGGVASNDAVVAAFEKIIGAPVHVHPYNRVSGAIGAALAARDEAKEGQSKQSHFKGLDPGPQPLLRSFECRHCSNNCEVNVIETREARCYFGDVCERFTSLGSDDGHKPALPSLTDEFLTRCEQYFATPAQGRRTIGIPRASTLMAHLPFWAVFFRELDLQPVLSSNTGQQTLTLGLKNLAVGVCLPIKLTAGHIHTLLETGVDLIFVPSVVILPGDVPSQSYSCPYAMAVPYMIGAKNHDRFITPAVSFVDEESFVEGFDAWRGRLGASSNRIREAYQAARSAQDHFDQSLRIRAGDLLRAGGYRHVFAILGKPYNTFDAFMNLNLFERLRRMGVFAVPLAYLPLDLPAGVSDLPWRFSADIHRAAVAIAEIPGIHPIIISNFGCGPDAFTFKQIEDALRGRPYLILEFDEHRGEAGLITRLEAFIDRLEGGSQTCAQPSSWGATDVPVAYFPASPAEVRIPYFADHSYAFSGLWKHKGHNAEVLPLPDDRIRILGEKYTLGKECHAYSMFVGDLVDVAARESGKEVVFYFPGTAIPCLLHQYGAGMQVLLRELGIGSVKVSAPTGKELLNAFGSDAMERFYMGLLAIELCVKAVCEIRPYEKVRGTANMVHRGNLLRIEMAIGGGDIVEALDESLRALMLIPVERNGGRPLVGVAGDLYTKVNQAANNDLYQWLEDRGLEVWPSLFQIDLLDFGISRRLFDSASRGRMQDFLLSGSVAIKRLVDVWKINRVASPRVSRLEEPGYLEMKKLAAPYMPNEAHELLFLNTVKIVDFARRGADGIINAVCFNCMVGNASAAIIEKIRNDYHDIPIVTAVYSGGEEPSRAMVLEAFVSQVKRHHVRAQLPGRRRSPVTRSR
jgi:predicted CoA-substrate-specific enzyme activase